MADKGIPSWPKVTIRLYDEHNAEVKIAGRSHPVNHHDPRQAAIALVAERAGQLGRPVKATAIEADGASWPLVIHPDGQVDAVEVQTRNKKPIWPILAAAGLALVLIAGTAIYLLMDRTPPPPQPTTEKKLPELPAPVIKPDQFAARPVPPGWSTNAAWTVDIAPDSRPAVSPDGSEVAVITPDQKLAVLDSAGKVLWQDEVPRDALVPVYTTVDAKPVLAVATPKSLFYWPGDAGEGTEIELPDSAKVQFFGSSPLVVMGSSEAGASVVSGGELKSVPNQPRLSTILLAEGDRTLMARYQGPLYWSQPDKDLVTLPLKPPSGARGIDHVVAASTGRVIVHWSTGRGNELLVTVNSTANGNVVATCPKTTADRADSWKWVPDQAGKVAALGECLVDFTSGRTYTLADFRPLSVTRTTIFGETAGDLLAVTPGGKPVKLAPNTARPWGVAGEHAIVVHNSVLYALDKK